MCKFAMQGFDFDFRVGQLARGTRILGFEGSVFTRRINGWFVNVSMGFEFWVCRAGCASGGFARFGNYMFCYALCK